MYVSVLELGPETALSYWTPQHARRPSVRTAQVRLSTALTAVNVSVLALGPETSPLALSPQQAIRPSVRSAQVWLLPVLTAVYVSVLALGPETCPEKQIVQYVMQSSLQQPSRQTSSLPQHMSSPPVRRAQVCAPPVPTEACSVGGAQNPPVQASPPPVVQT